jgi:GNAT superfamily N-acetyltransferase
VDLPAVARTLHEAFRDDPISSWIFPHEAAREELHPGFMRVFAGMGLSGGEVYLTPDAQAVAVWYTVRPGESDESGDIDRLFAAAGACAPRARALDAVFSARHPAGQEHLYLHFVAVRPDHQGHGLGTALLRDRLAWADKDGLPAYLESSTPRSAALYARLGFAHRDTIDLPEGGPTIFPVWRDPHRQP